MDDDDQEEDQVEQVNDFLNRSERRLEDQDYIGYITQVQGGGKGRITNYLVLTENYHTLDEYQRNFINEYFRNLEYDQYNPISEEEVPYGAQIITYILHPKYYLEKERVEMEEDDENINDEDIGKIQTYDEADKALKELTYDAVLKQFLIDLTEHFGGQGGDPHKLNVINNASSSIDGIETMGAVNTWATKLLVELTRLGMSEEVYKDISEALTDACNTYRKDTLSGQTDKFVETYTKRIRNMAMTPELYTFVSNNMSISLHYSLLLQTQYTHPSMYRNEIFTVRHRMNIIDALIQRNSILFIDPKIADAHTKVLRDHKFTTNGTGGGPGLMLNERGQLMPKVNHEDNTIAKNDAITSILFKDNKTHIISRYTTKRFSLNALLITKCLSGVDSFNVSLQKGTITIIGYVLEPCVGQQYLMGFSGCDDKNGMNFETKEKSSKGVYKGFECKANVDKKDKKDPLIHQALIRKHMMDNNLRRLLLFHKLGSGKTCTSIFIADQLLVNDQIDRVYVFCTSTLRTSWIQEYCARCGLDSNTLRQYYTFITLNYRSDIKNLKFTDKTLVIIDEVHLLMSMIRNGSDIGLNIYQHILNVGYLILLSGTPVVSCSSRKAQVEYYLLMRLLDPYTDPTDVARIMDPHQDVLAYVLDMCRKDRIDEIQLEDILKYNEDTELGKYILGNSISYFDVDAAEQTFQRDETIVLCRASDSQAEEIKSSIQWESTLIYGDFRGKPNPPAPSLITLARMRKMSRRDSNYFNKEDCTKSINPSREDLTGRTIMPSSYEELKEYSMKYTALLSQIYQLASTPKGKGRKHLIYTSFLNSHGAFFIKQLIDHWVRDRGVGTEHVQTMVFHGSLNSEQKQGMINSFNEIDNTITKIIIVTDAGAIGINLLRTNYLHIVDSHFSEPRVQQVIGRIIRHNSHEGMPKEDQYVWIFRYLTYYTDIDSKTEDGFRTIHVSKDTHDFINQLSILRGIDIKLYLDGKKCLELTETFHDMMKNHNIEQTMKRM